MDTKKNEIRNEMMGLGSWSRMLLTCEVVFLRQVIPRKERYFDVVHVDESIAKKEKRDSHTTGRKMLKVSLQIVNALSLHERCSSEQNQKDIKAAKDQKCVVGGLKEDRIAGHLRNSHSGLEEDG